MRIIDQLSELGYGPAHFSRGELDSIASTASKLLQGGASLKSALMSAISMTCPSRGVRGAVGSFAVGEPVADVPERPHVAPTMPVMDGRSAVDKVADILSSQPGLAPEALEMLRGVFDLSSEQLQEARRRALLQLQKAEPARLAGERRKETLGAFAQYLDVLTAKAAESGKPEDIRKAAEASAKMKTYFGIGK